MVPNSKTYFNWFLLFYALWGFYTMPDYGVPLDELTQRSIGIENNRFFTTGNPGGIEAHGPFGPAFESVSYLLEQIIYTQPMQYKLYLRHILLFSIFLLALRCFYFIGKRLFKKPNVAGITAASLALYPPLFVHTHINSKDSLFTCFVIFSIYFFIRFFETKKIPHLVVTALMVGLACTLRITGLMLLFALSTCMFFRKEINAKSLLKYNAILIALSILFFYLFFPYLWLHPVEGIYRIFVYTSNNPWPSETLCAGQWIIPGHAPWWYLPVWMGVTIPLVSLVFFMLGLWQILSQKLRRSNASILIILLTFFIPLLTVIVLKPTLYDGWRHFQFLIVPLILISGFGLEFILKGKYIRVYSWGIAGYSAITFFMWNPFGYVYMNEIYTATCKPNTFAQDYWGLSAKPALEWIAKTDTLAKIKVYSFTESPALNNLYLPEKTRNRFAFASNADSANYRIELRRSVNFGKNMGKEVYSICPMHDTILRIEKLK